MNSLNTSLASFSRFLDRFYRQLCRKSFTGRTAAGLLIMTLPSTFPAGLTARPAMGGGFAKHLATAFFNFA
jgi:hypothetical protein